jgi:CheY-like chemotaxis protein
MKILVIDDEVQVGNLLAESIRLQGHEAILAVSGAEGLALLQQQRPDAVFLDIVMPEMSGIEVLRTIRTTHGALPVIVLTGRASSEEIDQAKRLGITDCIQKPFILNQLNHALRSLESDRS